MAAKKSLVKKSGRSIKRATTRMHPPRESKAATSRPEQKRESHGAKARVSLLDAAPSLVERVQAEREQLFKALSIVECCRFATASLLEVSDSEYMIPAFEAVCDLLNTSAGQLEQIASECEKVV